MKHMPFSRAMRRQRGGVALQVTLVLLVIGMVVGAALARGTFIQTKVASNFYDRQIAFQSAQAALRLGENAAQAGSGGLGAFRDCTATAPPCLPNPFADPDAAAQIVTVADADFNPGPLAAGQPQYVVEYLGNFPTAASDFSVKSIGSGYGAHGARSRADFYRITGRSSAPGDDRASVTLQSIYFR
jgi:type IV pilus assembly protein PilX